MEQTRQRILKIHRILDQQYQEDLGFLEAASRGPFELLMAVILSAQTTDRQVNVVSGRLFSRFPGPEGLSRASQEEVEDIIRSTGYFRAKAAHIIGASQMLVSEYGGRVPDTMEELTRLPGVGRKTASVILGSVYHKPAVIVDTHFSRVVRRLALSEKRSPEALEKDIAGMLPGSSQYRFSMTVNNHGRVICHARKPECCSCVLRELCPSADGCP